MTIKELQKEVESVLGDDVLVSFRPDHETGEKEIIVTVFVPAGRDVPTYAEQHEEHYSKLLYSVENKYDLDIPVFFTAA